MLLYLFIIKGKTFAIGNLKEKYVSTLKIFSAEFTILFL